MGANSSRAPSVSSTMISSTPEPILKIRNFCNFGDWKTGGIERGEAEALVNKLKAGLPMSLRSMVGELELRNRKNFEIIVPLKTPKVMGEVMAWWKDELRTNLELKFNGRVLYVVPERSEKDKPFYKLMGAANEKLNTEFAALVSPIFTLKASWYPQWEISAVTCHGNRVLVKLTQEPAYEWDPETMKLYFPANADAIMA